VVNTENATDGSELGFDPHEYKRWPADVQAQAASMLEDLTENPPKAWYCASPGRFCDGKPHAGYPYKHARADQWPPPGQDWYTWVLKSGRGAGKTRAATEWVRKMSEKVPRIAGVGRRGVDIRETMVEGDSGLIAVCETARIGHLWEPSKKKFTFQNGATVMFYSGEEPDSLRGPQHGLAWLDEPAHMPLIEDLWNNLLLGLRLGQNPRILVTTTPLPSDWMKALVKREDSRVITVSTYENLDNLAPTFREQVLERYEGTRLGLQELHGEIIADVEGSLWSQDMIESSRKKDFDPKNVVFDQIVVGVDPAGGSGRRNDETGIIVCGRMGDKTNGTYVVLDDFSGKYTPNEWASQVARAFNKWNAHKVVAEKNFGGAMVASTLRNSQHNLPLETPSSQKSKELRAEPVVALYEQKRVIHAGKFLTMETQQQEWVPGSSRKSPDRIDALVFAMTALAGRGGPASFNAPKGRFRK